MSEEFVDRVDAGRQLAARLHAFRGVDAVVLGLPRGGVPVAAEVARALGAPLDVIVVGKLGVPTHPEVAMGAIGEGGVRVLDRDLIARLRVSEAQVNQVERAARAVLDARVAALHPHGPKQRLTGRVAIIVDDGIATGATLSAACQVVRRSGARRVVVAAPVGAPEALRRVHGADQIVCPVQPHHFRAVGAHYRDFTQTSDATVSVLLRDFAGATTQEEAAHDRRTSR